MVMKIETSTTVLAILLCSTAFIFNCCDVPVEYNNPFDPNMTAAPPSDLKIDSASETFITISWKNNLPNPGQGRMSLLRTIVEYSFQKDSVNNFIFTPIDTVSGTTSTVTFVRLFEQSSFHGFAVYSIFGSNTTKLSNVAWTGLYTQPLAPSNVDLAFLGPNDCRIAWKDNTSSELSFQLERKIGSTDSYARVADLPANSARFEDTTVIGFAGDTLYYRLRAVLPNGFYTPYTEASVYFTLLPPTSLTANTVNRTSVQLTWNRNVAIGSGFVVERGVASGTFEEIGRTTISTTRYTDSPPDTTSDFSYRVRLFIGNRLSDPSPSVLVGFWPDLVNGRSVFTGSYGTMCASPDRSLIALTGNNSGDIFVLTSPGYQTYRQFQNDGLTANSIDIDVANQFVVAGFTDNVQNTGRVKMWRLNDGSLFKEWNKPQPVHATKFSPDGSLIATDGDAGLIGLRDFRRDTTIRTFPGASPIAISNDQSFIANRDQESSNGANVWRVGGGGIVAGFQCNIDFGIVVTDLKFFNHRTIVLITAGNRIFFGDYFGVSAPQPQLKSMGTLCDITRDDQYLIGCNNGLIIIRMNPWIVTSFSALEYANAISIQPDGVVLFLENNELKEFTLQNRWTSPLADPSAGWIQNGKRVPIGSSSHR